MGQKLPNSFNQTIKHFKNYNDCVLIFIRDSNLKSVSQTLRDYRSNRFYKKGQDKLIKNYGIGAQIIKALNIKNMILVTRSKKKVIGSRRLRYKDYKTRNNKMKPNILIITANFYEDISSSLTLGAITELKKKAKVKKIIVPGVFEIPVIVAKNINKYDAFIALGCVIKGKTPHFNFISKSTINAIM